MGIYVAGMHRTGTSALARFTGLLIAYEGHRRAAEDNAMGHWEHPRINDELERAFRALGGDWASPPLGRFSWSDERVARFREPVQQVITSLGNGPWVLKDPRFCIVLHAMLELDQPEPLLIATYREPLEVANSIAVRDGYPFEYGLALWETYTRQLVIQARQQRDRALWVSYEALIDAPRQTAGLLRSHLADHGYPVSPESARKAVCSIDRSLNHHNLARDHKVRHDGLSPNQRDLLDIVRTSASQGETVDVELPPMTGWAAAMIDTRRPYARMEQDNRLLVKRLGPLRHGYNILDQVRARLKRPYPPNPFGNYKS